MNRSHLGCIASRLNLTKMTAVLLTPVMKPHGRLQNKKMRGSQAVTPVSLNTFSGKTQVPEDRLFCGLDRFFGLGSVDRNRAPAPFDTATSSPSTNSQTV